MLACWLKRPLRRGVGHETAAAVPREPAHGLDDGVGPLPVPRGPRGLAERGLEVARLAEGEGELEREGHGAAVRLLRAARRPRSSSHQSTKLHQGSRPRSPSGRSRSVNQSSTVRVPASWRRTNAGSSRHVQKSWTIPTQRSEKGGMNCCGALG